MDWAFEVWTYASEVGLPLRCSKPSAPVFRSPTPIALLKLTPGHLRKKLQFGILKNNETIIIVEYYIAAFFYGLSLTRLSIPIGFAQEREYGNGPEHSEAEHRRPALKLASRPNHAAPPKMGASRSCWMWATLRLKPPTSALELAGSWLRDPERVDLALGQPYAPLRRFAPPLRSGPPQRQIHCFSAPPLQAKRLWLQARPRQLQA